MKQLFQFTRISGVQCETKQWSRKFCPALDLYALKSEYSEKVILSV